MIYQVISTCQAIIAFVFKRCIPIRRKIIGWAVEVGRTDEKRKGIKILHSLFGSQDTQKTRERWLTELSES